MKKSRLTLVCGVVVSMLVAAGIAFDGEAAGRVSPVGGQRREAEVKRADDFEVQVLVDGRPREQYFARQARYVEALEGREYELRIRNPLPVRVAVALSVDGLNTIDARRSTSWEASKWVIEPYQTIIISGWQMSSERARRFYFTTERDSYAAKLGRASDLGLISAVFYREHARPRPVPLDVTPPLREESPRGEMKSRRDESMRSVPEVESKARTGGRSVAPAPDDEHAATGIGRSVRHDVRWVNLDLNPRAVGEVRIRYEYADALVRLGILPRVRPEPDPLRRRERARGFDEPRFCPEP